MKPGDKTNLAVLAVGVLVCGGLLGQVFSETPLSAWGGEWSWRASPYLGAIGLACLMLGVGLALSVPMAWVLSLVLRDTRLRKGMFEVKVAGVLLLLGAVLLGWYVWSTIEYGSRDNAVNICRICKAVDAVGRWMN